MWSIVKSAVNSTLNSMFNWAENHTLAHEVETSETLGNAENPEILNTAFETFGNAIGNTRVIEAVCEATDNAVCEAVEICDALDLTAVCKAVNLDVCDADANGVSSILSPLAQKIANDADYFLQSAQGNADYLWESAKQNAYYLWESAEENPAIAGIVGVAGVAAVVGILGWKMYQRKGMKIKETVEEKASEVVNVIEEKASKFNETLNKFADFLGDNLIKMIKEIKISEIIDENIQSILQSKEIDVDNINLEKLISDFCNSLVKWSRDGKVAVEDYKKDPSLFIAALRGKIKFMLNNEMFEDLVIPSSSASNDVVVPSSSAKPASNDVVPSSRKGFTFHYTPSFRNLTLKNILPSWNKINDVNPSAITKSFN